MADNELLIEIKGSAKEILEALESVKKKGEDLEGQLAIAAKVSGAAFAAFTAEIGFATAAFGQQQLAVNKLSSALKDQGLYSDETVRGYKEQADAIERKTGVDASAILSGQALLQSMIGQIEVSDKLTQGIIDLAARTGKDLNEAFTIVGQAINGHTRGMKGYGIEIDLVADRQRRLEQITEGLSQKFDGAAAAANTGLAGVKGLHAAFDELQRQIGEHLAPATERMITSLTNFFHLISDNKALSGFIADNLRLGALFTAAVVIIGTGVVAFGKLKESIQVATIAMEAFGISTKAALVTSGIGIALIALTEAYLYFSNKAKSEAPAVKKSLDDQSDSIAKLRKEIEEYQKSIPDTGNKPDYQIEYRTREMIKSMKYELEAKKKHLSALLKEQEEYDRQAAAEETADRAEAARKNKEQRALDALRAHNALLVAEAQHGSKEMLALRKEEAELLQKIDDDKFKSARADLQIRLAEVRALEAEQGKLDQAQKKELNEKFLEMDKDFLKLSEDERKTFLIKNRAELQSQIETESTTRQKAAKAHLDLEIKSNNQFLENQRKFGTAYATIFKFMHSEVLEGAKDSFGQMAQFQQSSNETLKSIGKASAIANIITNTADSAMAIFKGFQSLPFGLGIPLGIAGAAAAVAFGAEQIGKVTGAAAGGLITGGMAGMDSVPAMLMPGELVVPTKNYEEVVSSVARSREERSEAMRSGGSGPAQGGEGYAHVEISFKGDKAAEFFETKIIERRRMGISKLPKV